MGEKIWEILTTQSWSFCKYLPENGIIIQGQVTLLPVEGKPNHKKWCEQGSWSGNHGKSYSCTLLHEYVLNDDSIKIYSGPDTKILLHDFTINSFKEFPLIMQHTHVCGQDHYACKWVFLDEHTFEMHYTVLGPKKNYRIQALYTGNS